MAIANYTTSIKVEKTIAEIQMMLGQAGASQVLLEFDKSLVTAVSFRLMCGDIMVSFRLPANIDKIYVVLQQQGVAKKLRTRDQAARVAWRIIKDWLRAQLAIVEAEQAEMVEVFLPYAQDATGATVYDRFAKSGFKLLASPDA